MEFSEEAKLSSKNPLWWGARPNLTSKAAGETLHVILSSLCLFLCSDDPSIEGSGDGLVNNQSIGLGQGGGGQRGGGGIFHFEFKIFCFLISCA